MLVLTMKTFQLICFDVSIIGSDTSLHVFFCRFVMLVRPSARSSTPMGALVVCKARATSLDNLSVRTCGEFFFIDPQLLRGYFSNYSDRYFC